MIEINAQSPESDADFPERSREMYYLMGENMTHILGEEGPDWRTEVEFRKWKNDVLLVGLAKDTIHILLLDSRGLRGFLSYSTPSGSSDIYVNEIQIRTSARKDGVTLRRLLERFYNKIENLPQKTIRTYANQRNHESQQLLLKAGFKIESSTDRGNRFTASKFSLPGTRVSSGH
jgi:hypothetical protein